jgi:hypothetical protein
MPPAAKRTERTLAKNFNGLQILPDARLQAQRLVADMQSKFAGWRCHPAQLIAIRLSTLAKHVVAARFSKKDAAGLQASG